MGDTRRDKPVRKEDEKEVVPGEQKRKATNEKLRQKLEKLKKDDPNIYPVF